MDKNIIQDSIEEIEEITELFYQEKKDEAFGRLDKAIGNMMTVIDGLFSYKAANADFELDEEKLTNILKDAMNALQDGDVVLLADILQYDYLEYMQEVVENI